MSLILKLLFIATLFAAASSRFAAAESSARQVAPPKELSAQAAGTPDYIPLITPKSGSNLPIEDLNDRDDLPARTVFFELNPVDGVTHYSIQVKALSQLWLEPYTAELDTTTLRLRLTPGQYKLRTRSFETDGQPGRWSSYQRVWIHFNSPKDIYPPENATIAPKGGSVERLVFEWPAEKLAKDYIFRLYNEKGEMLRHVRTRLTYIGADMQLNTAYAWSVIPQSDVKEPEIPIEQVPMHSFRITKPAPELHLTKMEVAPVVKATSYDFEFVKLASDKLASQGTIYHSKEPNYSVALGPGQYEMRVRTNFDNGFHSNWSPPRQFWVAIRPPIHVSPDENAKIDPTDDLEADVRLKWVKPSAEAKIYRVFVWDEQEQLLVDEYTKDTHITVHLPHEKKYHWTVIALQDREKTRGPASAQSPDAPISAFEIEHYKRLDLGVSEEPSQVYAWGRYLTSVMAYKASNYDNNTQMTENVFGGTGELAVGYWNRKTDFGVLAAGDESGFTIRGKTYAYSYGSLLFGYRTLDDAKHTRWRFWLGGAYKETPEIMADGGTRELYFNRLKGYGPEARVSYLGEFNDRWGYHVYASYLSVTKGLHTINNEPLHAMNLTNFGVYGAYRWSNKTLVMLGYSYQVDSASYLSADPVTHGTNTLNFSGHFLSITIEEALQKPQR